jgi:hypothetical protein
MDGVPLEGGGELLILQVPRRAVLAGRSDTPQRGDRVDPHVGAVGVDLGLWRVELEGRPFAPEEVGDDVRREDSVPNEACGAQSATNTSSVDEAWPARGSTRTVA